MTHRSSDGIGFLGLFSASEKIDSEWGLIMIINE
jgi:hypothetical protein